MAELLTLQTPDFELSVWAKDIRARATVYHNTLGRRASGGDAYPEPVVLRFAPAVQLDYVDLNADALGSDAAMPDNRATLTLNAPLFFENTQYQFEWVFFEPVSCARLAHRSESISGAFRFVAQRGQLPARLTGTIYTANDVGWMRLPLVFVLHGKTFTQHMAFEVLPTKMALHQD
ncbi:MAG TPA: hypothetical protein PK693_00870 [Halothiobacillus sp.]|nr:hypothetical protein [Halothiobacillus sp.]HQS28290.1 hypothetical protein [Halothiobacillus sp.]